MRKLFSLFIILPLIVSINIGPLHWEWDWDFNFDWDFDKFLEIFKSAIPQFIKDMQDKIKNFMNEAEEQKDAILQGLKNRILELQQQIKEEIKEQQENAEKHIKELIEKGTEIAKYLSYKVCDIADMDYEECRNDKKKLLSNLLGAVKDNFGECSVIIGQISKLTEDASLNLKYILFLIDAITENPDAIEKGKSQIVYDILNCLEDKLEKYWPAISAKIGNQEISVNTKLDITNLLLKSYSNLVNVIHFEEIDGYITKANEATGLIPDSQAKKIHQGIFSILKKLNEFGEGVYNISANLALNVIVNPGGLNVDGDAQFKWIYDENKGIGIRLHSNYMLREKGAKSIQAVIFDSPFVSLRARNEKEGGTSNTFVGITLYDADGNEIIVKDFNKEDLRPEIFFKKTLYNAMTTCLYYNEEEDTIENKGIISTIEKLTEFNGEEFIKCVPKHLSSFTIGSYEQASIVEKPEDNKGTMIAIIVACCIGGVALLVGGFFLFRYLRRKNNSNFY